jgi:hypothetical protein
MKKVKFVNGIIEDLIITDEVIKELNKEKELILIKNSVSDDVINEIKRKKESMRTFSDQKKIELRKFIDKKYEEKFSKYDEYKELVVIPYNKEYNKETETLMPIFKEVENKVEQSFVPMLDKQRIKQSIKENKDVLKNTDYIIIKCYESKISMSDIPYSQEYLDEILTKRQAARDKINELESLIK